MVSIMRKSGVIFLIALFISSVDLENIKYAIRIRNFSVESETKVVFPYNVTLCEHNRDRWIVGCMNFTKDVYIKSVNAKVHRCHFERSKDCELFQNLTFTRYFKRIAYMKNQVWSPLIENIIPRFSELPVVKKNLYCTSSATLDTKALVTQYPQFINYFWRVNITIFDQNDKRPMTVYFDGSFFPFIEGNEKRDRKNITRRA